MAKSGPLIGTKVVEFAGIGPGPFVAMMLSDLGADVVRIDRKGAKSTNFLADTPYDVTARGRRSIALDLKSPMGREVALKLVAKADAIVEGFRPGVMERLGLGPETMLQSQPRLVYGRMTGWGQSGPYAKTAGHDINYIAISGVLHAIGLKDRPVVPLNFLGDYVGALVMVIGIVSGILHSRMTGVGQVVDTAMSDAAAYLTAPALGVLQAGFATERREENMLDGGRPFYGVYCCSDDKWITIGSIEPQFFALLMEKTGLAAEFAGRQHDKQLWPAMKTRLTEVFKTKTQAEWCAIMEATDVCFAPVLPFTEATRHHHNAARQTFVQEQGVTQPSPVPRFSQTPGVIQGPPPQAGAHSAELLEELGYTRDEVGELRRAGVV